MTLTPILLTLMAVDLFDGKTLNGWVNEGGANFRVENGVITVDKGPYTWLRTEKVYTNYELKLEYKTTADGNSGIFLRSAATGKPHETGYELQIFDERKDYRTGSLVGVAEAIPNKIKPGEWNTIEVLHTGPKVIVKMNGVKVVETTDQRSLKGHLGLQFNPNKPISFRKIRVREL
jgi:hypothetical protein